VFASRRQFDAAAIDIYRRAICENPNDVPTLKALAAAGRLQSLLANYNRAGFDDQALYFLGESLWRLEQKEEARAVFRRLIQEESQSEWAPPAAARLEVALVRTGPPKPKGPGTWERLRQGMGAIWDELGDTARSYRLFN
jgi:tetratricopeptide (TPR) repeat protein